MNRLLSIVYLLPAILAIVCGAVGVIISSETTSRILISSRDLQQLTLSFGEYRLTYNTSLPLDTLICGIIGFFLISIGFWWREKVYYNLFH